MKNIITLLSLIIFQTHFAQTNELISSAAFELEDITSSKFTDMLNSKLENSQFIFIGEQHGIKEVTDISNQVYAISKDFGYNTLCIETDKIAADLISDFSMSDDAVKLAKENFSDFPYAIPFYGNDYDYSLFKNVIKNNGEIWGIDQTFMVQFRLNFYYLAAITKSKSLKKKLEELIEKSITAYDEAVSTKNYMAPYIFKYTDETHEELIALTDDKEDITILEKLKRTKTIYEYNFNQKYYLNNYTRSKEMKRNFMVYYNEAKKKEQNPKVIFKLGSNHASRGLSKVNIFDIGNLASEIANSNEKESVNILVFGTTGTMNIANPFAPVSEVPFNNDKYFPDEIKDVVKTLNSKYYVLDLQELRYDKYSKLSKKMQDWVFNYDVLILVKDAMPLKSF